MLFCIYSFCTCKTIHCGSFWKRWKLLPFPERKANVFWCDCTKSASTMPVNCWWTLRKHLNKTGKGSSITGAMSIRKCKWWCGPHQTCIFPVFFSFSSLKSWAVAPNNRWKWRTTGTKTCSLGHLECVLNRRNKDRCKPAKHETIVVAFICV